MRPDGGVAGVRGLADVVEQFVAVVGAEGDAPIVAAGVLPCLLFLQQRLDDGDHVGAALEMGGFLEGAVGLVGDVAKVGEMDAGGEARGNGGGGRWRGWRRGSRCRG